MKKDTNTKLLSLLVVLFLSLTVNAQNNLINKGSGGAITITGSNNVNLNDTKTYYATSSLTSVNSGTWTVIGATIVNQNGASATIKWTSPGSKVIKFSVSSFLEGFYNVNVNAASAPNIPSTPTISSQNCTSATLQMGTPPTGITWYWQGTNSNGTSTGNSNSTYSVTSSGTYYLRARNTGGAWSVGSNSINVILGSIGGTIWYADFDGDNLGDPNSTLLQCTQPPDYVSNNNDQCPYTHGGGNTNGCPPNVGISNENYLYTIIPQIPVTDMSELIQNKDALKSIVYYDGLGRPNQSIGIKQSNAEKDIVTHMDYDNFGRQKKEYLPYVSTDNDGYFKLNALDKTNNYYITNYVSDINSTTPNPFSEKEFDDSPLSRVLKQSVPGYDWRLGGGHEIEFNYQTNVLGEVRSYTVTLNSNLDPTLSLNLSYNAGYYSSGTLYKTVIKDENHSGVSKNHTIEKFLNKKGQTILRRDYANVNGVSTPHDTYYVYDDFGNLTYVLPPMAEANNDMPDSIELSELCFQYRFDQRSRIIEKKIPGKEWEYIVYDKLDRPVLTQDANLREDNKWLFTKYDKLGRDIYSGIYSHGSVLNQEQMQAYFDTAPTNSQPVTLPYEKKMTTEFGSTFVSHYYSTTMFPFNNIEILTVNYYDDYNFNRAGVGTSVSNVYGENSTTQLKGLATGSKVKVLGTSQWITNVLYYDEKAQPIYLFSKNDYLLSTDIIMSKLDFTGKIVETTSLHTKTDDNLPTITTIDKFEYDHIGRIKKQSQKIGNQLEEVIVHNTYDGLGQLISKGVGGKTTQSRLQTVDYKYNIRGWLTNINDTDASNDAITFGAGDLFGFEINYNNPSSGGTALYNGNISQTLSKTTNDNVLRKYTYEHDALNRILEANYNGGSLYFSDNATGPVTLPENYSLKNVSYDKNGNILTLDRYGIKKTYGGTGSLYNTTIVDGLTYSYEDTSNKLRDVSDAADNVFNGIPNSPGTDFGGFHDNYYGNNYEYDANGNMIKDHNKGITNILYNHLNLPTQIEINGSYIYYHYDANGIKLKKRVATNLSEVITSYAGNYIYEETILTNGGGLPNQLQFFSHSEGYVKVELVSGSAQFDYVYQYKDHLGNVRLSYLDTDGNGSITQTEIIEESNYYPFGLKHIGYNFVTSSIGNSVAQKWDYLGEEFTEDFGLNWHSYKWRNADPAIGRFFNSDPITEDYYYQTNYQFASNNPVWKIEIEGLEGLDTTPGGTVLQDDFKTQQELKNIAIVRKASSFWNGLKALGSIMNHPWKAGPLILNVLSGTKPVVDGYIDDRFTGAGKVIIKQIENNIHQIAIEENISKRDAMLVWGYGTSAEIMVGIATDGAYSSISRSSSLVTKSISPDDILFSQSSVNGLPELTKSMTKNGWKGGHIDVVDLLNGKYGTLDNTRVLAAHEAGIATEAVVRQLTDLLTPSQAKRFSTKKGGLPKTWGDAFINRIKKQKAAYRKNNPEGSYFTSGAVD